MGKKFLKAFIIMICSFAGSIGLAACSRASVGNNLSIRVISEKDKTCEIKGYKRYNDERDNIIFIPKVLRGYKVISIGSRAFQDCTSLTTITIPDSVTSIGSEAFYGCSSLESITLPFVGAKASATSASSSTLFGYIFGSSNYSGCYKVEQYYKSGSHSTYYIPSSLKSVTITGGNILYGAFDNCSSLISIEIPDSVTKIGSLAFDLCTSLTTITIPDSVTSIGSEAFFNCLSLTTITIPDSVTSIGDFAFYGCSSLPSIVIPDSVTSIGENAFEKCTSLTTIEISDSVNSIDDYAFFDCTSLTTITIPDSVTSIGFGAFFNCLSLTSVTIGNGVTSIESGAFSCCSSLTSIVIPDSVNSIYDYVFANCTSLTDVFYTGSEEQWNSIYIGFDNGRLTSATIHYNYKGE